MIGIRNQERSIL